MNRDVQDTLPRESEQLNARVLTEFRKRSLRAAEMGLWFCFQLLGGRRVTEPQGQTNLSLWFPGTAPREKDWDLQRAAWLRCLGTPGHLVKTLRVGEISAEASPAYLLLS